MLRVLCSFTLLAILALLPTSPAGAAVWTPHPLAFPAGIKGAPLYGVSCSPGAPTKCTTVGRDVNTSNNVGAHAQYTFYGDDWAPSSGVIRNPGPKNGLLNGVSCTYLQSVCMTVGSYGTSGGVPASMAQRQSGGTWQLYNLGIPAGASRAEFNSVSCSDAGYCMAVGYKMVGGDDKPYAMRYNGSSWVDAGAALASNATLKGVSCPLNTTYCVAVGSTGSSALAQVWNGSSWTTTSSVVLPSGGSDYVLNSISCVSTSWCLAVGKYATSNGNRAIASRWNGSSWNSVPNLTWNVGVSPIAYGVSCISTTKCYAVGTSSGQPFADVYDGVTPWSTMTLPLPSGATSGELRGIYCIADAHCHASGWAFTGSTQRGLIETLQ